MSFLTIYLITGLIILGLMALLWLVSLGMKNSSIVDIFWGTGGILVTGASMTAYQYKFNTLQQKLGSIHN